MVILGGNQAMAAITQAQLAAANLQPVLEGPITNDVHKFFAKRFASRGSYGGDQWQPLSARTLANKRLIGRSQMGILRRFNTLWASLTKRSHPLGYRLATAHQLVVGTSVPYAEPHQLGLKVPKREIVVDAPEAERERWATLIAKHAAKES